MADRDENGKFIAGNKASVGNNGGIDLKYTVEEFRKRAEDYFKWVDDNPWIKNDVVKGGEMAGTPLRIPTQRPYTYTALAHHMGMSYQCFLNYENRPDFIELIKYIREKIDNQQFEGAMVGAFNANITARRLGLSDKKEIEGGDPNKPIKIQDITGMIIK